MVPFFLPFRNWNDMAIWGQKLGETEQFLWPIGSPARFRFFQVNVRGIVQLLYLI
jgi:hypothetical protein